MSRPAAYIDGSRLAACFEQAFGADLCDRLKASTRLQARLSALVCAQYSLAQRVPPEACSDLDRTIALFPAARLVDLAQRSGAIFWASTIANVVLAREVEALHQQLGELLCSFALAHRDLAGPEQAIEPLDDVGSRIADDGWRCLSAWCDVVPAGVGARVRLKLPPNDVLDSAATDGRFREAGPSIIRRAAG
jgi:YOP proteins translocation protein K (YscK)